MRSAKHHMIVLVVFLLASQTISVAGDLNGMYSEADLKYWKGILEPLVNQIGSSLDSTSKIAKVLKGVEPGGFS